MIEWEPSIRATLSPRSLKFLAGGSGFRGAAWALHKVSFDLELRLLLVPTGNWIKSQRRDIRKREGDASTAKEK